MRVNDSLAYYTTELILGVKSFMALAKKLQLCCTVGFMVYT